MQYSLHRSNKVQGRTIGILSMVLHVYTKVVMNWILAIILKKGDTFLPQTFISGDWTSSLLMLMLCICCTETDAGDISTSISTRQWTNHNSLWRRLLRKHPKQYAHACAYVLVKASPRRRRHQYLIDINFTNQYYQIHESFHVLWWILKHHNLMTCK